MAKFHFIPTPSAWSSAVPALVRDAQDLKVWCLIGDLGAGKTTLVTALAHYFEVLDVVQSPTFSLVNSYATAQGSFFHHIDLYRLEKAEEFRTLGLEEYLSSGDYCCIEWGDKILPHLLTPHLRLTITAKRGGRQLEVARA